MIHFAERGGWFAWPSRSAQAVGVYRVLRRSEAELDSLPGQDFWPALSRLGC